MVLYSNALRSCSSLSRVLCWPMPQWIETVTRMAKRKQQNSNTNQHLQAPKRMDREVPKKSHQIIIQSNLIHNLASGIQPRAGEYGADCHKGPDYALGGADGDLVGHVCFFQECM